MSYRGAGITHNKLLLRRYGIARSAAKEGGERAEEEEFCAMPLEDE